MAREVHYAYFSEPTIRTHYDIISPIDTVSCNGEIMNILFAAEAALENNRRHLEPK